jgi:hypothetical protein
MFSLHDCSLNASLRQMQAKQLNIFHCQIALVHNERHWIPACAGMTFEELLT